MHQGHDGFILCVKESRKHSGVLAAGNREPSTQTDRATWRMAVTTLLRPVVGMRPAVGAGYMEYAA